MSDGGEIWDDNYQDTLSDDSEDYKASALARLPDDIYGDMLLTLVTTADITEKHHEGAHGEHPFLWLLISSALFILTVLLQFGLSIVLFFGSIRRSEAEYEAEGMLDDLTARLHGTALSEDSRALGLCKKNHVHIIATYPFVLFLWFTRMVQEIAQCTWLMAVLYSAPTRERPKDDSTDQTKSLKNSEEGHRASMTALMLLSTGTEDKPSYQIAGFTPSAKWSAIFLIALPKLLLSVWITWVGASFLLFSHETTNLILKAFALQLFMTIDVQIFKSFVSEEKKARVHSTSIVHSAVASKAWANYVSSLVRLTFVVTILCIFYYAVHADVVTFRYSCWEYKYQHPVEFPDFLRPDSFESWAGSLVQGI